mmetsp:Transcript_66659/g.203907  ORF Transcript_66659/g.203907 Transcript_66659/m.203907 type:complete len:320 (-) Transcript_66659:390-1349(-)|eukprot:CAMPEP_0198529268 /NCGR_PEP_ID=MMETSP1462-20131121/25654_1 /TAXON_ID=1333877 /ORGANISM="Brandtodinium nutriculum, Strain RCC3387" /LENGTH=319 /DNA_ID=CAMNT_0044259109 /DNA_START=36 /DNA_END=995 /DNA_ORIENTATION=+
MVCGFGTATEPPLPWHAAFGDSYCMSPTVLLVLRVVLAVVVAGHFVWYFEKYFSRDGWYFFIFLTNWSFMLEAIFLVMVVPVAWLAGRTPKQQSSAFRTLWSGHAIVATPQPWYASITMFAFMLNQPLSFIVFVMYWTLDKPIWKFCDLNGHAPDCFEQWPDYLGFFVHGIDWLLLFISFFISVIPYKLKNSAWLLLFFVLYLAWTYAHFYFKIGRPPHFEAACAEKGYTLPDCPIYFALDWGKPTEALKTSGIALGLSVATIFFYAGLGWVRDSVGRCCCGGSEAAQIAAAEAAEDPAVWEEALTGSAPPKKFCGCCG